MGNVIYLFLCFIQRCNWICWNILHIVLLTTVSNTEAARETVDVAFAAPWRHIDEVVDRVFDGEAKRESVKANISCTQIDMLHFHAGN